MKPYPKYKESGGDWLGKVPEHWEIKRLGGYFFDRKEKVSDTIFKPLSVTKNGIVPLLDNAAKTDNGDNRKKVCIGDFVINSRSDRKGSSGLSELEGSVSVISIVLKSLHGNPKYFHYLYKSHNFKEEFYKWGNGIVADLWSTRYSDMKNILIPIFNIEEQDCIANFLDRETTRIDSLIEEKDNFIALLKEKRQALISHAVTKGLDTTVKMKDSGVEWLGEVPEHWGVKRFKYLAKVRNGQDQKSVLIDNGGFPIYGSGGEFGRSSKYLYNKESVLLGRKGTIDKPLFIQEPFWSVDTMFYTVIFKNVVPKLFFYLSLTIEFNYYQFGSAVPSMTQENLHNINFSIPNYKEQEVIVDFLDTQTTKIDLLIKETQNSIELLKEHRTALISAAVTGKIDVREVA